MAEKQTRSLELMKKSRIYKEDSGQKCRGQHQATQTLRPAGDHPGSDFKHRLKGRIWGTKHNKHSQDYSETDRLRHTALRIRSSQEAEGGIVMLEWLSGSTCHTPLSDYTPFRK